MNCPNCSNPKIKYQTKKDPKKSRTDFKAECKKCGWKGEIGSAGIKEPELKQENLEKIDHILCNVSNAKMNPSDTCRECKPIDENAKMKCSNCQRGTPKYKEGD
jgi:hypothetical protein